MKETERKSWNQRSPEWLVRNNILSNGIVWQPTWILCFCERIPLSLSPLIILSNTLFNVMLVINKTRANCLLHARARALNSPQESSCYAYHASARSVAWGFNYGNHNICTKISTSDTFTLGKYSRPVLYRICYWHKGFSVPESIYSL